jgi:DNA-binding transcriptional ArsR family regulator
METTLLPRRRLDARSLVALAHPLRIRIRDRLRREGPANATQLAREFGETSGATSYHLRMLARHGFVEPDPERGVGRERWWRATPEVLQIYPSEFVDDETASEALRVVDSERMRMAQERLERWLAHRAQWSGPWRDAAENSVFGLRLSPEQMRAFADEMIAIVDTYMAAEPGPGAASVELQLNLFPTGTRA